MDLFIVYLVLKKIIKDMNKDYIVSFNDMDSNGKNVIGVYIKGSAPSQYRRLSDGSYINKTSRVQILGQSSDDFDSLLNMISIYTQMEDMISVASGSIYTKEMLREYLIGDLRFKNIIILNTSINVGSNYTGKTEQGLPMMDLNFDIEYSVLYEDDIEAGDIIDDTLGSMDSTIVANV